MDLRRADVGWFKDMCVVTALRRTGKKASGSIATKQKVMTPPANEDKGCVKVKYGGDNACVFRV